MSFWSPEEEAFLRECVAAKIGADKIAPMLGRAVTAIRMKRYTLGLPPPRGGLSHVIGQQGSVTVAEIKRVVSAHFKIPVTTMTDRDRTRDAARPRQVAMFFARELSRKSYPRIGDMFGGRDHSTVIHAVRNVERLIDEHNDFKDKVSTIKSELVSTNSSSAVDKSVFPSFADISASA